MRKATTEKRAAILASLCEGVGVNATARLCGVSKITVLRLLADAGQFCADYHDAYVRNLTSKRIQCDEIWQFVYSKEKNVPEDKQGVFGYGDVWTWVSIDADSKLAVTWYVGDRDVESANAFMKDTADRLVNRIQITTDGFAAYREAVGLAWYNVPVDFAMLVKTYGKAIDSETRYSPPECTGCKKKTIQGEPDKKHISTSFVERQNLTMRMQIRRFTRLTNAFSKKLANHCYALAIHYFHYNFIRKHTTLKTTTAVAAGIATAPLTMLDLVRMIEAEERRVGGRLTDYLPASEGDSK